MSVEIFKSMVYRNNKVFTRQCSNNISPKHYYTDINPGLTRKFNELGKANYEKWFILNCLIIGGARITNDSNVVLKKLEAISNQIWNNPDFRKIYDKSDILFEKSINIKENDNVEKLNIEIAENNKAMENFVSNSYDNAMKLLKNRDQER